MRVQLAQQAQEILGTSDGSICVPGSYVSKSSSKAPNNAFPRRLTL